MTKPSLSTRAREYLRHMWTQIRLARGYCAACSNLRNQHDWYCDLHLEVFAARETIAGGGYQIQTDVDLNSNRFCSCLQNGVGTPLWDENCQVHGVKARKGRLDRAASDREFTQRFFRDNQPDDPDGR